MTPVHMAHVDVQLRVIGIVISIHVAGMYAFSPVVGYLTDRIGRYRTIAIGLVLLLASAVISGSAAAAQSDGDFARGFAVVYLVPNLVIPGLIDKTPIALDGDLTVLSHCAASLNDARF